MFDNNKYNILVDGVHLWDNEKFLARTKYTWPCKIVGETVKLPPATKSSEAICEIKKNTIIEIKKLLYDNILQKNKKRQQVFLAEVKMSEGTKEGYVYIIADGKEQAKEFIDLRNKYKINTPLGTVDLGPELMEAKKKLAEIEKKLEPELETVKKKIEKKIKKKLSSIHMPVITFGAVNPKDKDILDEAARKKAIDDINANIKAYYRGYVYYGSTGFNNQHLLYCTIDPVNGYFPGSNGKPILASDMFYDVSRNYFKGKNVEFISEVLINRSAAEVIMNDPRNKSIDQGINTFCNFAAARIAREYGAPDFQFYKGNEHGATNIEEWLKQGKYNELNKKYGETIFEEVEYNSAEQYAKKGGLAVCVGAGHISTLIGGYKDNIEERKYLKLFQSGASVGDVTYSKAWAPYHETTFFIWRKK